MNPNFEDEEWAVRQAIDARRNVNHEETAAKIVESNKASENISSDMDEAARVAEEALKRLNGEAEK